MFEFAPHIQFRLDQVKQSYRYYAWLGIANPSGRVAVAADHLLEGEDVSERPWFKQGSKQIYLGDIHKAVLLAKKVKAIDPSEPMRFIDFAAPIYDAKDHHLKGVLAAHADWAWAKQVLNNALSDDAVNRGIEIFIVNQAGEILYPFKSIGQVQPPTLNKARGAYFIDKWHTDEKYLTTDVPVISKTSRNLGWHVVIRQPVSIALQDVSSLIRHILIIGFVVSLLLLFATYKIANNFSRPIEKLVKLAKAIEQGKENIHFQTQTTIPEIQGLSQSLESMTETLLSQKQQLLDVNQTLEEKVQQRTHALEAANIELEKLVSYDALTGLHNRRASNEYIEYLFDQLQRSEQVFAVLLMDIDFFKKVNDTYGHEMGDYVLQSVAKFLQTTVRATDFVARFGGEEFIILLPDTTLEGAVVLAEKIRQVIADAVIIDHHQITASIGVTIADLQDREINHILRRADKNLYLAKEQGRNRVVSSQAERL